MQSFALVIAMCDITFVLCLPYIEKYEWMNGLPCHIMQYRIYSMVNTALTVYLCSIVTNEARKLIELATIIYLFFADTFILVYLYD